MHSTYLTIVLRQRDEECKCCAKKITATSFVSRPCAYNCTLPSEQCPTLTWKISDNCFFKEENQIVHFHLILVPIAKGKIEITLTTTKLKVTKEIELPGGRREGLDYIRAGSWSQTIPIVSAPHVLKIQILAQNVFAMRVVFLHSSQSILGPSESKPSYEKEKCHYRNLCNLPQYQPLSSLFSLFSISTIIFELMTGRVIWRIMGSAIMDCCESLPCSTSFGNQQRGS